MLTLRCGLSPSLSNNHIAIEPISLSCGHVICKECIPNEDGEFECKTCGQLNKHNLKIAKVNLPGKEYLKLSLGNLFEQLERKYELCLNQLSGNYLNR
jgi:hypothetical protein